MNKPVIILISGFMTLVTLVVGSLIVFKPSNSEGYFFPTSNLLTRILDRGRLIVLTRNAPTTYYLGKNGPEGLEYELISDFAKYLDIEVEFIVKNSTAEIIKALSDGKGDIAAAGLTKTQQREKEFLFGPEYQTVKQQVVCRRGNSIPRKIEDLSSHQLLVSSETSYVESLKKLKVNLPELEWIESHEYDTEQILEKIWNKEAHCTVADSNIVAINRRYHPELIVPMNLGEAEPLTWLLPKGAIYLNHKIHTWLKEYTATGELDFAIDRYYGFVKIFDYVDIQHFKRRIDKRLPKYIDIFKEAAEKNNLAWTLLAAQSYQESHWNTRAKSPTGVRGIMMLTLTTARELGIRNRINPKNSIFGGAKYLKQLKNRVPDDVEEPDRTWFALAAYNVGMGHIHDARKLAIEMNKNPNKWGDLSDILPLLSQKKYYSTTKHGYARGSEPVLYVQRIRNFQDLLEKHFETLQSADTEVTTNEAEKAKL